MAGAKDRVKGTVTWYDDRKKFGFIRPKEGGEQLFVHESAIKVVGTLRYLFAGEDVEFVPFVGDDGCRRAINVTGPGGSYVLGGRIGPCYECGIMGHLARKCPATRAELGKLSEGIDSEEEEEETEEEEEEEEETNDEDWELPRWLEDRNWAELPRDILYVIFRKIATVEIIRSAQFVCRPWRQLSHEQELWKHIEVRIPDDEHMEITDLESIMMLAVERSEGCLEELHIEGDVDGSDNEYDAIMAYISNRATKLRRLRLISIYRMSEMAIADAVKTLSLLEELEISFCCLYPIFDSSKLIESVGLACPQLKSFRHNDQPPREPGDYIIDLFDVKALAIATHMQQLHHLQLIGSTLTNTGLLAILDNCPNLRCLDLRGCFNVNIDENMKKKCAKIKDLRLPKDSTLDYEFFALLVGSEEFHDSFNSDNYDYDDDYDYDYFDHDVEVSISSRV